ncbi:MAG: hypothetical protein WBI55_06025 [Eubacteriales bacterium]
MNRTEDGYVATATLCKLCALSKRMGGADPCSGWCLDPMIAMISAAGGINAENITVEGTLMTGDFCRVYIHSCFTHSYKELLMEKHIRTAKVSYIQC